MGISDRDYIRRAPPTRGRYGRGGPSSVRMWSVNTWLIAICVAVFFVDRYTPADYVIVSESLPAHVTLGSGVQYRQVLPAAVPGRPRPARPGDPRYTVLIFDDAVSTTEPIGRVTYARMHLLQRWFHFATARTFLRPMQAFEVWRLVGFQFLHAGHIHLLFNMLGLFFFGPMVERYLGSKRYLAFYLLCVIFVALMYLLLNLGEFVVARVYNVHVVVPGLLFNSPYTPLIGASAGVFGVLMAGAYLAPNALVLLFFILPMRLKTLAYLLVALALFTVVRHGANAGGEAGHLGGALAGFYFIRRPHHLHGFFDILGRIDPTSHHYRRKGLRTVPGRRSAQTEQIDRILAKISAEGLQSLTESEKRAMREASERR